MNADAFADLVQAQRTGTGRWKARCPAHADKRPSLTIAQGHSAILLRCWSHGCTPEQIVTALGLPMSALFHDATLTPDERAEAARQRTSQLAEQAHQRAADREQRDRVYKLEKLTDALGAKLARNPDDRGLGRLFHVACERWHDAESALYHDPHDGPMRQPEPSAVPQWIQDSLVELGQNFTPKETACCEQAA